MIYEEKINVNFLNKDFVFYGLQGSSTNRNVVNEIKNSLYDFTIENQENPIIIDIGANAGLFSVIIAEKYPNAKIYSFEPIQETFYFLYKNIRENNKESQIFPFNLGVGGKNDFFSLVLGNENTGGATSNLYSVPFGNRQFISYMVTLDSIFDKFKIESADLVKIDCEGSEYEILTNFTKWNQIKKIVAEFHENDFLIDKGYNFNYIEETIRKNNIEFSYHKSRMHNA